MTMRSLLLVLCGCWFAVGAAAQTAGKPRQWALNDQLIEISGLAAASSNTVFAHNDEFAIIYEIDIDDGGIERAFALGDPTTKGDFEGIAVYDGRVYLTTSAGLVYEAEIGEHRGRERFNVYDTGVGAFCEVEGLSMAPEPGAFLLLCKRPISGKPDGRLSIYKWNVDERRPVSAPEFTIPYSEFLPKSEREAFRPAGIEWDEEAQSLMVISSRSHIVYTFSAAGKFVRKHRLAPELHLQSEGITIVDSGVVLVADEGNGRRRGGVLSVYNDLP